MLGDLGRVIQKLDNAIHRINHYPADSVVCFVNIYPLDMIYPVDSVIQPLNNWGLFCKVIRTYNIGQYSNGKTWKNYRGLHRLGFQVI